MRLDGIRHVKCFYIPWGVFTSLWVFYTPWSVFTHPWVFLHIWVFLHRPGWRILQLAKRVARLGWVTIPQTRVATFACRCPFCLLSVLLPSFPSHSLTHPLTYLYVPFPFRPPVLVSLLSMLTFFLTHFLSSLPPCSLPPSLPFFFSPCCISSWLYSNCSTVIFNRLWGTVGTLELISMPYLHFTFTLSLPCTSIPHPRYIHQHLLCQHVTCSQAPLSHFTMIPHSLSLHPTFTVN